MIKERGLHSKNDVFLLRIFGKIFKKDPNQKPFLSILSLILKEQIILRI